MSSFAEAAAAAAGSDAAAREACRVALLAQPPTTWREESLRLLLARALREGDEREAEPLAGALPASSALEERLVARAEREPLAALTAAAAHGLSPRAWRRLLSVGAAALRATDDSLLRDLLATALCASLAYLPPALAFLEAVGLARCFAGEPGVDTFHLAALGATPCLTEPARADLCLAVGAALAGRGATEEAFYWNAEAARLTASTKTGPR